MFDLQTSFRAPERADASAGINTAISSATIAITTNSSTKVNPFLFSGAIT